MLQNLFNNRKTSGLILGGLAAFAYYKYSKMTAEDKSKLAQTIKDTGKSIFNQIVPGGFNNAVDKTDTVLASAPNSAAF